MLESEAVVASAYKDEIAHYEQQTQANAKLMEAMEQRLEEKNQQLLLNNELMKLMQDRDIEYEKMLEYWTEIHRANYVYMPTKNDDIDKKLSEYINNCDLA